MFFALRNVLGLPLAEVQTLVLVMLVVAGQGTVYLVRERGHFWHSLPSRWLVLTSVLDISTVVALASGGILMAAVSPLAIGGLILTVLVFLAGVDVVKVRLFDVLGVR